MERRIISIMKGDKLILPDLEGVETAYEVTLIEGTVFRADLHLKNLNRPEPDRIVTYEKVDE